MPGVNSNPIVTLNIVNASEDIGNNPQKVLFIGQRSTGTAFSGDLIENILNDETVLSGLFGPDSMISAGIRASRVENKVSQFDAIPLVDNGSGVDATGTLGFSGTASAAGTLIINVGSAKLHRFTVAVPNTTTAAALATLVSAALDVDLLLPVTNVVSTADVDLTAVNAGTYGNSIGLSIEGTVPGITSTITAMTGGSVDPVLTNLFDVVGTNRYQTVIWPYSDVSVLTAFLDPRFNADNAILDGAGFYGITDTLSNHLSRLGALNSENLVEFCDKTISEGNFTGPSQLEIPYIKASQFGAIRALRLTEGASITKFVISTNGSLDAFGGAALASKPYFNTPFANNSLIGVGRGFTEVETRQIEAAGGAVIANNTSGNTVIAGQVPTTFKTDTAGNPDITLQFLNYRDTISGIREFMANNLRARFAETRLTEGDTIRGRDQTNATTIANYVEELYQTLSGEDFVLVEAGDAAIQFFKDNLVVTINKASGTATITMIVPIVTQLRTILATVKVAFSTEG